MTNIFYPHTHTELRRKLRNNATLAERELWKHLQNKRLLEFKFRRQAGIGRYIADFYCPTARLIIEIDGDIHNQPTTKEYDLIRTHFLEDLGLNVIRFTNQEVLSQIDSVLVQILRFLSIRNPL
ncbi:MAG: endonuclease domain-containing protein [Candidatus Uhrbacteria bacterium]